MEGANRIAFLDRPEDGEYVITMPNMYARGILFGKMVLELGDECNINNEQTDYHAKIDFKTKGFFSGEYNSISGKAKHGHDSIADISGKWSDEIDLKKKVCIFSVCRGIFAENEPKCTLPGRKQINPV